MRRLSCVPIALLLVACTTPPSAPDAVGAAGAPGAAVTPTVVEQPGVLVTRGAPRVAPTAGTAGTARTATVGRAAPPPDEHSAPVVAPTVAPASESAPEVAPSSEPHAETPQQRRYREVLETRLAEPAGDIRVRVTDAEGRAVSGAEVRFVNLLWAWEGSGLLPFAPSDISTTTSGADGEVRFPSVGTRAAFAFAVLGDRVACAVEGSRGHYRRPDDFELRLGPGVPFGGRVLDQDGNPVAGASVEIDLGQNARRFLDISRPDGRFGGVLVPAFFAVDGVRLRVGAAGFDLHERRLDASAFSEGAMIDVTLPR